MAEIIYNSKTLKQRHKNIYQDIFSRCFLVASTPVKFFWGGEYGSYIGAPLIGQNLPLRTYVSLENIEGRGKIEIVDSIYIPAKDKFESQMNQLHRLKLEKYLITQATSLYQKKDFPSLRIHSLAETLPGSGLGMSGSFAAALATVLLLDSKRVTLENIIDWVKTPTYLLSQNRSFDRIHRLGWKISSLLHDGISTGGACFLSLIPSVYPVIYYSEKRTGFLASPMDVRVPLNIRENYNLLDRLFYGGIKLDELFNFKEQPSWPLEFYLIYSGDKSGGRAVKSFREIDDRLVDISEMVIKGFDFIKTDPNILNPVFYQICAADGWEGLHASYLGTVATVSLEILYHLRDVFEFGGSDRSVSNLCNTLNTFQDSLRALGRSTTTIRQITHSLHTDFARQLGDVGMGVKITGAGRGGNVLVVTPAVEAHDLIAQEIKVLSEQTKQDLWLTYSSSRDGLEERGLVIEQYLPENIYSSFVSQNSVVVSVYSRQGKSQITLAAEEFEKRKKRLPLLFDLTTDDIYIRGRLLTSKDLKSAKTTVAIFKILLDHLGQDIEKGDLPKSSYIVDRNEIQSKIISPIQGAVRRSLRRPLPIKISGPIRQYTLKIDPPPFDIYVLIKRV